MMASVSQSASVAVTTVVVGCGGGVGPLHRPLQFMPKYVRQFCTLLSSPIHPLRQPPPSASSFATVASLDQLKLLNAAQIELLSASVSDFCANSYQRNRLLCLRVRPIVAGLERAICAPGGRSRIVMVGSIPSGMGFDLSPDIDLAFVYCGANWKQQDKYYQDFWSSSRTFLISFLEAIADTVKKFGDTHSSKGFRMSQAPEIISQTAVPLVMAKMDNGIRIDLTFPRMDFQSLRNTLMVRHYLQADRRFLFLFHWLRQIFLQMGLKNSKSGLFSSYHILLLVLHFLNRKDVPDNVLPTFVDLPKPLLDQMFTSELPILVQKLDEVPPQSESDQKPFWTSKCTKNVGELAFEMVDYYAKFDPWTTAISIQHGRTTEVIRKPLGTDRPPLKVMDPFHRVSSTRSSILGEALVVGFQFLHAQMSVGKYVCTFPSLDGLADEFASHVRDQGCPWAMFLEQNPAVDYECPADDDCDTVDEEEQQQSSTVAGNSHEDENGGEQVASGDGEQEKTQTTEEHSSGKGGV